MLRPVKGTNFVVGSFVDAVMADAQKAAGVRCVLKATSQPLHGQSEARFAFHAEYLNLNFDDAGVVAGCPQAFVFARDWLAGAEAAAAKAGGKVLVHSWSGMGKAVRLVAAHLAGWDRAQYADALARVYADASIPEVQRRPLPAFEKALLAAMDAKPTPVPETVGEGAPVHSGPVEAKPRKVRTKRPKL